MGCVWSDMKHAYINRVSQILFYHYLRNKKIILCFHDPHTNGLSTGDLDDALAITITQFLTRNTHTFIIVVICDDPAGTRYCGLKKSNKLFDNTSNSVVIKESSLKYLLSLLKSLKSISIICSPIKTDTANIIKQLKGTKYMQGGVGEYNYSNSDPGAKKIIDEITSVNCINIITSAETGSAYPLSMLSHNAKDSDIHEKWMLFCLLKLFLLMNPYLLYALGLLLSKTIHPLGGSGNTAKEILSLHTLLGLDEHYEPDPNSGITKAYHTYLETAINTKLGRTKTEEEFNKIHSLVLPIINMIIQIIYKLFPNPEETLLNSDGTIKTIGEIDFSKIKINNPLKNSGKAFDAVLVYVVLLHELYSQQHPKEVLKDEEYKGNFLENFTDTLNDALIFHKSFNKSFSNTFTKRMLIILLIFY